MENTNICQEKSYTELKKKFVQCEEQETLDIIKSTPTESKKENLSGISYTRNCPKCNKLLTYSLKGSWKQANDHNKICKSCIRSITQIGKRKVYKKEDLERNCPKCDKLFVYKTRWKRNKEQKHNKLCLSCSRILRRKTEDQKIRICPKCNSKIIYKYAYLVKKLNGKLCRKCNGDIAIGRKHSPEAKRKIRIAQCNWLKNHNNILPQYNPNACEFIDEYGKQNNYNFRHALNGGECHIKDLGYFVDGYDKEKNVVFEYDEKHHYTKNGLKAEDIQRMGEIKQHLQCKFLRFNEKLNEIKEY